LHAEAVERLARSKWAYPLAVGYRHLTRAQA
jgi:hypothetical protein